MRLMVTKKNNGGKFAFDNDTQALILFGFRGR